MRQLERQLETRTTTAQAVGMLMERHMLTAEAAFAYLTRTASTLERPVVSIARELLETRVMPAAEEVDEEPPPPIELHPTYAGSESGAVANLSRREREILVHIGSGMSNAEIAATMFLGLNTVKTYIRTAYRKIGATRRSQAVIWAHQFGLVHVDGPGHAEQA